MYVPKRFRCDPDVVINDVGLSLCTSTYAQEDQLDIVERPNGVADTTTNPLRLRDTRS